MERRGSMVLRLVRFLPVFLLVALAGCFAPSTDFPRGEADYAVMPAADPADAWSSYRIGALDTLSVRVFQELELSFEELQVRSQGHRGRIWLKLLQLWQGG